NYGHGRRYDHGDDFAPRVDAPPVPAQDVDRSSADSQIENDRPTLNDRGQSCSDKSADQHQQNGKEPADSHVMPLCLRTHDEPTVQMIYQVRDAPIELRAHRGHESSQKGGNHESPQG